MVEASLRVNLRSDVSKTKTMKQADNKPSAVRYSGASTWWMQLNQGICQRGGKEKGENEKRHLKTMRH